MRLLRTAVVTAFFAAAAFAQNDRGSIEGRVLDPVGEALTNVIVQAKNLVSGKGFRATTAGGGAYAFKDLPAGTYEVMASVAGFNGFDQKNVAVAAAKTTAFDVHLRDTTQLGTLGEDRLAIEAAAKRHKPPVGPTPRMKDGKPDLSGTWWSPRTLDPGRPEWLPNAIAVAKERTDNNRRDSPQARCLPSPVLRLGPVYETVQSAGMMIVISDDDSPGFHQILSGWPRPSERSRTRVVWTQRRALGRGHAGRRSRRLQRRLVARSGIASAFRQAARDREVHAPGPRASADGYHGRRPGCAGAALYDEARIGACAGGNDLRIYLSRKQPGRPAPGREVKRCD